VRTTFDEALGLRLCRSYVRGDAARFKQLLTGQFVPADLESIQSPVDVGIHDSPRRGVE
jgi:hypothetical protein